MKPHSIVLGVALLTACAPSYGQTVTPGSPQDYQAMMESMEKAQAQANRPGDERLGCDELQKQLVGVAQDPAFQAYVKAAGDAAQKDLLVRAMPELKARAHDLNQLAEGARFLFLSRPLDVDEAAGALLTDESRALLARAHAALAGVEWNHDALEQAVREVAEDQGVKLGKLAQPLRAALTGRTTSPGIFDVLALLGKSESLARLEDQMLEPNE